MKCSESKTTGKGCVNTITTACSTYTDDGNCFEYVGSDGWSYLHIMPKMHQPVRQQLKQLYMHFELRVFRLILIVIIKQYKLNRGACIESVACGSVGGSQLRDCEGVRDPNGFYCIWTTGANSHNGKNICTDWSGTATASRSNKKNKFRNACKWVVMEEKLQEYRKCMNIYRFFKQLCSSCSLCYILCSRSQFCSQNNILELYIDNLYV